MIICHNSYKGEVNYDRTTVKFEESDFNNPNFGIGFTFEYLIVPLHLKERFLNSDKYKFIMPILASYKYGKIEYKCFKRKYREKQLRTLLN